MRHRQAVIYSILMILCGGRHPSPRLIAGTLTALLLYGGVSQPLRAEAPLWPAQASETTLALRLPDLPLPDLGRLGDLRLPVPSPANMDLHFHAHWYLPFQTFGFKIGTMYAPFDNYSTRSALGLVTSGRFNINPITLFSLEMELMGSNNLLPGGNSGADDWSANTFGLFAAFRFGDPVFFKLRGGWMASSIYRNDPYEEISSSGTSTPLGLGIGWRVGPTMIMETEVTWTDDIGLLTFGFLF